MAKTYHFFLKVSFNVGQDRRTNQFFARNVAFIEKPIPSTVPKPKRSRGVISTMKDSFGFIEREDALKEIFFHITEFGPNLAPNSVQPGVEVEFDILDRHVSYLTIYALYIINRCFCFCAIHYSIYITTS